MRSNEKRTILVVDDIPENIALLTAILHDLYRVRIATNGEGALAIVRGSERPDLVLLDVMMPDMDGLEVCRRLKGDPTTAKVPVIFVTSREDASDEAAGFAVGAADYVAKPVNPELIKARVKAHIELKLIREDLERKNEVLREIARLRAEVEAINRHDLKGPLTVILNAPALILADESLLEKHRKLLHLIQESGQRMLEMINRTIDMYKMEMGTYRYVASPVDLLVTIGQVSAALKTTTDQRQISLVVAANGKNPEAGESFLADGEELLFYSLLTNLLKNAIEASPAASVVSVALECGTRIRIAIHNDGAIPVGMRARFFEKLATEGKLHGSGLGVYSASLIARTLGGAIGFETSEAAGTTITVELPGKARDAPVAPASSYAK